MAGAIVPVFQMFQITLKAPQELCKALDFTITIKRIDKRCPFHHIERGTRLQVFQNLHLFIGHGVKRITFIFKYYNMVSSMHPPKHKGRHLTRNHLLLHPLLFLFSLSDDLIQVW